MTHFSKKYKVIAVDLAGSGGSGDDRQKWTMAAFGEDVAAVIKKLDLKKVVLVGFSMGAPVILETAKRVPERLAGLVLVDDLHDIEMKYPPEMIAEFGGVMMDVVTNPTLEKLVGLGFFKNDPKASFERCLSMLKGDSRAGWKEGWATCSCGTPRKNSTVCSRRASRNSCRAHEIGKNGGSPFFSFKAESDFVPEEIL